MSSTRESLISSIEYNVFTKNVAKKTISIKTKSTKEWSYYDYGPRHLSPVIFVPGFFSTAEIFFMQMITLPVRGYRFIAIQPGLYSNVVDWVRGLEQFLNYLEQTNPVHLFGEGLGGYLVQAFAFFKPERVASLVLCNTWCDHTFLRNNSSVKGVYKYMPEFILKKHLLELLPTFEMNIDNAKSIDFVVHYIDSMSQEDLAFRTLIRGCTSPMISQDYQLDSSRVTIIESLDFHLVPTNYSDELYDVYPNARKGQIKEGGPFPFLSAFGEVNLIVEAHLRALGYQADVHYEIDEADKVQEYIQENDDGGYGDNYIVSEESDGPKIVVNRTNSKNVFAPVIVGIDSNEKETLWSSDSD